MTLAELVDPLSLALGCPLVLDAQGECNFACEGVAVCLVPCNGETAFLARAHLGPIAQQTLGAAMEGLLAANLFGDGLGGSSLCLDTQGHVYLVQRFRESLLEPEELCRWLERFVRHAARCIAWLGATADAGQAHAAALWGAV